MKSNKAKGTGGLVAALRRFLDRDQAEMNAAAERRGEKIAGTCHCSCCEDARAALSLAAPVAVTDAERK